MIHCGPIKDPRRSAAPLSLPPTAKVNWPKSPHPSLHLFLLPSPWSFRSLRPLFSIPSSVIRSLLPAALRPFITDAGESETSFELSHFFCGYVGEHKLPPVYGCFFLRSQYGCGHANGLFVHPAALQFGRLSSPQGLAGSRPWQLWTWKLSSSLSLESFFSPPIHSERDPRLIFH